MKFRNNKEIYEKYLFDLKQKLIKKYDELGLRASGDYEKGLDYEIEKNGIENWEKILTLLEKMATYDLPEELLLRNTRLKEYCQLRIKSYKTIQKAILEETDKYDNEINDFNVEIEKIIDELSNSQ